MVGMEVMYVGNRVHGGFSLEDHDHLCFSLSLSFFPSLFCAHPCTDKAVVDNF